MFDPSLFGQLETVSEKEFQSLADYWGEEFPPCGFNPCRLRNPFLSRDYSELFTAVVENPALMRVSVRVVDGSWLRKFPSGVIRQEIDLIIQEIHRGFPELPFLTIDFYKASGNGAKQFDVWRKFTVEFAELDNGMIVGYKIAFRGQQYYANYDSLSGVLHSRCRALWVP